MSRDDDEAERGRAEPIDVEYEPAGREYSRAPARGGIGGGTALILAVLSAGAGAAGGAVAPRVPAVNAALDRVVPVSDGVSIPGRTPADSATAIEARLDAIEGVMNAPLAVAASGDAGDAGTAARVFALQSGLREVEGRLSRMPSTEEVAALVTEVRGLQEQLPAVAQQARTASEAARAAFAVAAAGDASSRSGPFVESVESLKALLPDDANVAALEPLARTGAPTRTELRDRFDRIDNDIIRAARQSQAGAGFWGRIQAALAQWIIIRRAGEGDTPSGVVERASAALEQDNLQGAIEQLNHLTGEPRRVAQPWITAAQRRLDIDTRLAAIRTELSRRS
ncbi:COG4223 family protein [Terricaulis sp.]|uniref:COG4223 family protein n=1 Tax=Terricaulis sp. TaxID=2768686 RepID=UPI003783D690